MSVIKLAHNQIVRRFTVSTNLTFSQLQNYVSQYFPSLLNYRMTYIDEENDTISLTDETDLIEALQVAKNFKNGILRINLTSSFPQQTASLPLNSSNLQLKEQFLQTFRQLKSCMPLLQTINEEDLVAQIFSSPNGVPLTFGPFAQTGPLDLALFAQSLNQQIPHIFSQFFSQIIPFPVSTSSCPPAHNPFSTQPFNSVSSPVQSPETVEPSTLASEPQPTTIPSDPEHQSTAKTSESNSAKISNSNTAQTIEPPHTSQHVTAIPTPSFVPHTSIPETTEQNSVLSPFERQFFEETPEPFEYEAELKILEGMGFCCRSELIWRLRKFHGHLAAVVDDLLNN